MNRLAYFADFPYVFGLVVLSLWLGSRASDFTGLWLLTALAGYAVWLLSEYLFHRHVLHKAFKREHWMHHIRPKDMSVSNTYQLKQYFTLSIGWLFAASVGAATRSNEVFSLAMFFASGFFAGYIAYRFHHHVLHHWSDERLQSSRWFKPLHDAHEVHHLGGPVNFGVQTLLFDRLFGTHKT